MRQSGRAPGAFLDEAIRPLTVIVALHRGISREAARVGLLADAARAGWRAAGRLVGFDNAHPVAKYKCGEPHDHRHRLRTIRPYDYRDAATLLGDIWTTVDAVLRERGVIP